MKTELDCIPCNVRQALNAARMVSPDPAVHEQILREVLLWASSMDMDQTAPEIAQHIHRRMREIAGVDDPYRAAKDAHNRLAMELAPALRLKIDAASDPLLMAARLAIAGNAIDLGAFGDLTEADVRQAVEQAMNDPFFGETDQFRQALARARSIVYLGDNAGEIVFDQFLVEQIGPQRVTFVVRGAAVINDVTLEDARAVGLDQIVEVIDTGSDAPGIILEDCSPEFQHRYAAADMIIAKGQGNFESLSDQPGNIFFLFKVKCPVIARYVHQPEGTQMLVQTSVTDLPAGGGSAAPGRPV